MIIAETFIPSAWMHRHHLHTDVRPRAVIAEPFFYMFVSVDSRTSLLD